MSSPNDPNNPGGRVRQDHAGMNAIFIHSSLDDAGLSIYAFRVYAHLARRANQSGKAWPGVQSMADKCGMSKNTARAAINELVERGMIIIMSSGGGRETNNYLLTAPADWNVFENSDERAGHALTGSPPDPVTSCTPGGHGMNGSRSPAEQEGTPLRKSKKGNPPPSVGKVAEDDPAFPKSKILKLWNELVPSLRSLVSINGKREQLLRGRWTDHGTLEFWRGFFAKVEASDKLTGRVKMSRDWTADFDWIIIPGNFAKVLEGKYDNPKAPITSPPADEAEEGGFFRRKP